MTGIFTIYRQFKVLYRVLPGIWLLIITGFLALWTMLMLFLDWRVPPEQSMNPGFLRGARRRGKIARVLNLFLMLLGLMIIALVTFVRRGSVEHRVVFYPLRVLYGLKAPADYWQVMIMNLVLYVPFACGLAFCVERGRGWIHCYPVSATIAICLLTSILAEGLQYITGSGLAEVDDVLMNTLGGVLGGMPCLVCGRNCELFASGLPAEPQSVLAENETDLK